METIRLRHTETDRPDAHGYKWMRDGMESERRSEDRQDKANTQLQNVTKHEAESESKND